MVQRCATGAAQRGIPVIGGVAYGANFIGLRQYRIPLPLSNVLIGAAKGSL